MSEIVDALLERLRHAPAAERDARIRRLCDERGLSRGHNALDGRWLLAVDRDSSVLEIGAGLGDSTIYFASMAARTTVLSPDPRHAALIGGHLEAAGARHAEIVVSNSLRELPFEAGAFEAVTVDQQALAAFGCRASSDLRAAAAELRRVTRPGASLVAGMPTPFSRVAALDRLRRRLSGESRRSLDGAIKSALMPAGATPPGAAAWTAALRACDFDKPARFAPFPSEEFVKAILPLDEPAAIRYFLERLVRRGSIRARCGVTAARLAAMAGRFDLAVPYLYLRFELRTTA